MASDRQKELHYVEGSECGECNCQREHEIEERFRYYQIYDKEVFNEENIRKFLDQVKQYHYQTSDGEWNVKFPYSGNPPAEVFAYGPHENKIAQCNYPSDATFIANAHEDIPILIKFIEHVLEEQNVNNSLEEPPICGNEWSPEPGYITGLCCLREPNHKGLCSPMHYKVFSAEEIEREARPGAIPSKRKT